MTMTAKRAGKLAVLLAALLLLLGACSGGSTADPDPETAAQAILDGVEFRDDMVKADGGAAENYYRLNDTVEDYAIYMSGSRATAEEVAVLRMGEDGDIQTAVAILEKRVEDLIFQFEDYVPGEMVKLQDPVVVTGGNTAILILADDTAQALKVAEGLL